METQLDTTTYKTEDGEVSLRQAAGMQTASNSVGGDHRLEVYSTADHQWHSMHDRYSTQQEAQYALDSHQKEVKSMMFEDTAQPRDVVEEQRLEEWKANRKEKPVSNSVYASYE